MAQLKIDIVVDDNGATQKLHQVESAVKGVESSAVSGATALDNHASSLRNIGSSASQSVSAVQRFSSVATTFFSSLAAFGALDLLQNIASGIIGWARESAAAAGRIVDLSAKTGLTTATIQRMGFVAEQSGVALGVFTDAAFQLSVRISGGKDSVRQAVENLGLSFSAVQAMSPDKQWEAIVAALEAMKDPAQQNILAMQLFGKSGKSVLQAIRDGYTEMAKSATIAGDAQIRALDAADDAWTRFVANRKSDMTQLAGSIVLAGKGAQSAGLLNSLAAMMIGGPTMNTFGAFVDAGTDASKKKPQDINLSAPGSGAGAEAEAAKAVAAVKARVNPFGGAEIFADAKQSMRDMRDAGGIARLTADETRKLNDTLGDALLKYAALGRVAPKAMVDTWVATMKTVAVTNGLDPSMMGETLKNPTVPEIPIPGLPGMTSGDVFGEMLANPTVPALAVVNPFRQAFSQLGKDLPNIIFGALQGGGSVIGSIAAGLGAQFGGQFQKALQAAGGDLSKVSAGNKALGIAGMGIGAAFTGFDLGEKLGKGKGALAGAGAGALAGTAIMPGIGTAIGAGVGAIAGFFGGKKKDKEAAQQMADQRSALLEQFGGMAKLQEKAKALGLDMAKAFSTKKPQEFRAEIEKLNAAMDAHAKSPQGMAESQYKTIADMQADAQQAVDIWKYMSTSGKYSADVVQQAWSTANDALVASGDKQALAAQAANTAVSDLSAKILGIQQSFANEAPEEVMGVLEANARAQVAALEEQRAAAQANIDAVKADLQPLVDGGIKIPIDFYVRSGLPGAGEMPEGASSLLNNAGKTLTDSNGNPLGTGGSNNDDGRQAFLDNTGKVLIDSNGNVLGTFGGNNNDDGRAYHSGGLIKRMHSGGLMSDEVPIIGQTGEFMMSRRGVAAAGVRQLQRWNSGQSDGGGDSSLPLNVNIDGEVLARVILPGVIREAKRMGLYR